MTHTDKQDDEPQRRCRTLQDPHYAVDPSSHATPLLLSVGTQGQWLSSCRAIPTLSFGSLLTHALRMHPEATGITSSRRLPPV